MVINYEEMAASIIERVFTQHFVTIASKIAKKTMSYFEKSEIMFRSAFGGYLKNSYDKYSRAKTLLHRQEPIKIKDFFVIPSLKVPGNNEKVQETISANDIYDKFYSRHFLIIKGTAGMGKSTLLKYLFIDEIEQKRRLIPIFFELRDINNLSDSYNLTDVFFEKFNLQNETITKKAIESALTKGLFLFLLDGFDEIVSSEAQIFLKKLNDYCDRYSKNFYIVSTRPSGYYIEFERFCISSICGLDLNQAVKLIELIKYDDLSKQRFIKVFDNLYEQHKSFASNPLLLTMMFLTYDANGDIPVKTYMFYDRVFETLFHLHDATKAGFKREFKSGLKSDSSLFKNIFSHFCCLTYYNNELSFSYYHLFEIFKKVGGDIFDNDNMFRPKDYITDLVNAVCMLSLDGTEYSFTHRSFQEYFTAFYLKEQIDDKMKNYGLQIIKNDVIKAINDNVFKMLYDMAKEKCEKNILLPVIQEIEQDYTYGDKNDYYLKLFFGRLCSNSFSIDDDFYFSVFCNTDNMETNLLYFLKSIIGNVNFDFHFLQSDQFKYRFYEYCSKGEINYALLKQSDIGKEVMHLSKQREKLEKKFADLASANYSFFALRKEPVPKPQKKIGFRPRQ